MLAQPTHCSAASLALGFVAFVSHAQSLETGGWEIRTIGEASPSNPLVRVEVWAWFDPPSSAVAFGSGDFDFVASEGAFRDPVVEIRAYKGASGPLFGTTPGEVIGSRVDRAIVGQLFGVAGLVGSGDNPILVWSATWGTHDFTPRTVGLVTEDTSGFWIGHNSPHGGANTKLYPDSFFHGSGSIRVVPSPWAAGVLLLGAGVTARRRRR